MKRPSTNLILDAFRKNRELALHLKTVIERYGREVLEKSDEEKIKIMNFCGTHEWTTVHYGLRSLLPSFIEMIAGPGCPVCITPGAYVATAVKLASEGITVYTYGDSFRLKGVGEGNSLADARSSGADVRVVYGFLDAIKDAKQEGKESLFFGVGFETTAAVYATAFWEKLVPENLKFLSVCRLTPPAMKHTIKLHHERGLLPIKGIIAPGHVSTITGAESWAFLPRDYQIPTVVAGFEPIDVLLAVAQILLMLKRGEPAIKNEYARLVKWEGNTEVKQMIQNVFSTVPASWRGLGLIPDSGLVLQKDYERYDELKSFGIPGPSASANDLPPGCKCGEVIVGISKPSDCPLFLTSCTPSTPWGPCMVSSEGACAIWAREGAWRG